MFWYALLKSREESNTVISSANVSHFGYMWSRAHKLSAAHPAQHSPRTTLAAPVTSFKTVLHITKEKKKSGDELHERDCIMVLLAGLAKCHCHLSLLHRDQHAAISCLAGDFIGEREFPCLCGNFKVIVQTFFSPHCRFHVDLDLQGVAVLLRKSLIGSQATTTTGTT